MITTRTKDTSKIKFPVKIEKNGRTGRIKKWNGEKFGTYFSYAGGKHRNSFRTYAAAREYLENEFSSDPEKSAALNPLRANRKNYSELEQHLISHVPNATMREAINFFILHHKTKAFKSMPVSECVTKFINRQEAMNVSPIQITNLSKHYRRFEKDFGTRPIHEITNIEIFEWLASRKNEKTKKPWSVKTRKS
ncbi:MAG TPA: hypothetical protein VN963_06550, partial [bacterium]|nr:hypothetical protein [bacterium]